MIPKGQGQGIKSKSGDQGNKWVKATPEPSQPKTSSAGKSKNADKSGNGASFLRKGFLRKQKSTHDDLPQVKNSPSQNGTASAAIAKSNRAMEKPSPEKTLKESGKREKDISASIIEEKTIIPEKQGTNNKTPRVSLDTMETTSIGSIHSDDLMLDIDLEEYEELAYPPTGATSGEHSKPTRTRSRSRSGSRSRDNLERRLSAGATDRSCEKKISVYRGSDSSMTGLPKKPSPVEPIQELATLVEASHMTSAQRYV
jgi:hypothetical protein